MLAHAIHLDTLPDETLNNALDALHQAEKRLVSLTCTLASGANRFAFPQANADAAIRRIVGDVEARRYEFERALASKLVGAPYRAKPNLFSLGIELQQKAQKNDEASPVPALVAARHGDAEREAGFASFARG